MKFFRHRQATPPTRPHSEKGQGLIEIAIVIPFLIMVVIGVLDLGRMYFTVIIINNAAREGTRYLIQHPDDKENFFANTKAVAAQEAQGTIVSLDTSDVEVTMCFDEAPTDDGACDRETPARVTVTYSFDPILWPSTLTFHRSVEMMVP